MKLNSNKNTIKRIDSEKSSIKFVRANKVKQFYEIVTKEIFKIVFIHRFELFSSGLGISQGETAKNRSWSDRDPLPSLLT